MSKLPDDLKYTASHEWVQLLDDGTARIGITDHAQNALGDMVYIELPEVGATHQAEQECAVVESVKSASDLYCPVSGEIVEINKALNDSPETVNTDPYGDGWIFRVKPNDVEDIGQLLDAEAYSAKISEEE